MFVVVLLILVGLGNGYAQEDKAPLAWDEIKGKLFFQPNGSFFISQGVLVAGLSPSVGYRVTPKLSVGIGPSVLYVRALQSGADLYEWGGNVFARRRIGRMFFAQAEYEMINREVFIPLPNGVFRERQWVPGFLVGGGLFQQFGARSGFIAAVFYNLLWDPNRSNTKSPLVTRVGLVF